MPFTTPIYDEMERQNVKAAGRAGGGFVEPPAPAPAEGGRSFGFRSGATTPGGTADRRYAEAVGAGASLGEPTSFRAGAGAPTPIGVIRGTRQTFATQTGGPQLEEFATPLQARQAALRFQGGEAEAEASRRGFTDPTIAGRFGEYRPIGQTLAETPAREKPGESAFRRAQAGLITGQTAEAARKETERVAKESSRKFEEGFLLKHGVATPKEKGAGFERVMPKDVNPADYQAALEMAPTHGHEAAIQHYGERQLARRWLETQSIKPGSSIDQELETLAAHPQAWADIIREAKALPPAPPAAQGWWGRLQRPTQVPFRERAPLTIPTSEIPEPAP